ncbi:MAG: penicillin-binding protein 2 [bacterium]
MNSLFGSRIRFISISIFLFALFLVGRLYVLQVVENGTYLDKADRRYTAVNSNLFSRGTIFFQNRDGSLVSAATLKSGFTIAVNPMQIKDAEGDYLKLNGMLPTNHDDFIAKATKPNDSYEEIAKRVDTDLGQQISSLKIAGLLVLKERWRFYPGGPMASQTIGKLGYKGDEYAGRYGLERQYEDILARGDDAYINFFAQIFSSIKSVTATSTQNEGDIVTTIEPAVQYFLEEQLASTSEKWSSETTGGIIINPTTGEIYAMGVEPTFDPNKQDAQNVAIFSNPLVENMYEMGSIIKPLTIAAGIDTGVISATSTYNDTGTITINGKKVSNFDGKARGITDMQQVLSQSLNLGVARVVQLLGNKRFTDYMYNFGVGEKTGIDLPNEGRNLVSNLNSSRDLEHVTASFGQGISLTPINTVRVLSSLANGGMMVRPHLVKQINYKLGFSKTIPVEQVRQVVKESTAKEVARMMVYSVDNVLAGGKMKIPNFSVAAKTGTAQIAIPGGGGYSDTDFLHSFVGFFPAYKPQFFIFLYTLKPRGVQYGSETLTEPFMNIVKFLINYYEVPPDR